jgi:hypothetical protein
MTYFDDDNSDDWPMPPGFTKEGDEIVKEEQFDIAIVMGRPVTPNEVETEIGKKLGIDFSDPYDGSEKMKCKRCLREVWVGPMQREKMSEVAGCIVMCPEHAVQTMHEAGGSMEDVQSLGHEHERGN